MAAHERHYERIETTQRTTYLFSNDVRLDPLERSIRLVEKCAFRNQGERVVCSHVSLGKVACQQGVQSSDHILDCKLTVDSSLTTSSVV